MARDFKLSNFTYTTAIVSTNVPAITATTPTGDLANTGATLAMVVASGTSVGNNSDTKNVGGFLQSKQDNSSFSNFIAGNEITAVANKLVAEMSCEDTIISEGIS